MRTIPRFSSFHDDDLPDLRRMILSLYREDPPGQKVSLQKIRRTVLELSSHPDKGTITMIHVGDAIVGYVIVIYYWSNEYGGDIAHIDEFYVKPAWRNRGIGSLCLEYIGHVKGIDLKGIQVETTPPNKRAFAFYLRHGFKLKENRHLFRSLRHGKRKQK